MAPPLNPTFGQPTHNDRQECFAPMKKRLRKMKLECDSRKKDKTNAANKNWDYKTKTFGTIRDNTKCATLILTTKNIHLKNNRQIKREQRNKWTTKLTTKKSIRNTDNTSCWSSIGKYKQKQEIIIIITGQKQKQNQKLQLWTNRWNKKNFK